MRLEHVAIWTEDLERLTDFYTEYFGATAGARYVNQVKGYESCFLSFEPGARLELMKSSTLEPVKHTRGAERMGLTHLAVSVGSEPPETRRARRGGRAAAYWRRLL
jgi:lactoylglutathione lyase